MLFNQNYTDGQLPYKQSDKMQMFKVVLSAIFVALAIFMFLIGADTLIGVIVLLIGIVWNLFVPPNSNAGFVFSIIMGIVYALASYGLGLVANAFLYLVYYVPMQFLACKNKGETFIFKDKTLSTNQSVFVLVYYILFFVGVYAFSKSISGSGLCLLDSIAATLLAISAFARNLRIRAYYGIRLCALAVSIFMWALIVSGSVLYPGAVGILLMYVIYLVNDVVTCAYEKRAYNSEELEKNNALQQAKNMLKAEKKKREYEFLQKRMG